MNSLCGRREVGGRNWLIESPKALDGLGNRWNCTSARHGKIRHGGTVVRGCGVPNRSLLVSTAGPAIRKTSCRRMPDWPSGLTYSTMTATGCKWCGSDVPVMRVCQGFFLIAKIRESISRQGLPSPAQVAGRHGESVSPSPTPRRLEAIRNFTYDPCRHDCVSPFACPCAVCAAGITMGGKLVVTMILRATLVGQGWTHGGFRGWLS
jgi:hypothetical protein